MAQRETQGTAVALIRQDVDYIKKKIDGGNGGGLGIMRRLEEIEKLLTDHLRETKFEKDQLAETRERAEEREKGRRDFWTKVVILAIGMIITNIGVVIRSFFR